jgi:hypothetical protein
MEQRHMGRSGGQNGDERRSIRDATYVEKLQKKWGRYLEGIKHPHTRAVQAILYESQFRELQSVTEDTVASNAGAYTKYVFPVLRRVYPNLIAQEIVSVQPMTAPFGAVFYFEYKYARSKGQVQSGQNLIKDFDKYYSSEFIDREHLASPDGTNFGGSGNALSVVLGYTPVRPRDTSVNVSVTIQDVDADGTDTFVVASFGRTGVYPSTTLSALPDPPKFVPSGLARCSRSMNSEL